jgi:ATP-binding protein involved in chromosome partitioning
MSENILQSIYSFTKNYRDPDTNNVFDEKNEKVQVVEKNGNVNIILSVSNEKIKEYEKIADIFKTNINKIEGILSVNVALTSENNSAQSSQTDQPERRFKINAKNIIAIASGKGGVGKSTFAVNFAVALSELGKKVGILDADIYGPSVPRMMGISGRPEASENKKLIPLESYGIKCMSIGFLVSVDTPTIWRGPMVMKALEQMFNGVEWGDLDYLIIDLPPGTGDAQLTLAQSSKLSGSIIVSTPKDVALTDARKGINMFKRVNVPLMGLVENMSYFICDNCSEKHFIFSNDGAKKEAEKFQIPFLGSLPIDKELRIQSDEGRPACIDNPTGDIAKNYFNIANTIIASSE